ncbi:hypothetical protein K402DRAFT_391033 [Aulographum hederae CBS 113979]|uniref:CENP-V/GFA domain-containing protein n=1 Tax=Aulographum hederae CBS 113979 TaxID=1176131 RepID=A0A6G1H8X1_9PEZI|nr:hypothetical protein K402DRAFT_391033 [Aulographum hederae CBS 113979]
MTAPSEKAPKQPPYTKPDNFKPVYHASCYCGTIEWDLGGDALDAMYCHCETCQTLHGTPYQWAAVVPKDKVFFTKGADKIVFFNSSDEVYNDEGRMQGKNEYKLPCKLSCPYCHASFADEGRRMMLMLPPYIHFERNKDGKKIVPKAFQSNHHMFYGKRVADVADGLEKFLGRKDERPCDDEGKELKEKPDTPKDPMEHNEKE